MNKIGLENITVGDVPDPGTGKSYEGFGGSGDDYSVEGNGEVEDKWLD